MSRFRRIAAAFRRDLADTLPWGVLGLCSAAYGLRDEPLTPYTVLVAVLVAVDVWVLAAVVAAAVDRFRPAPVEEEPLPPEIEALAEALVTALADRCVYDPPRVAGRP